MSHPSTVRELNGPQILRVMKRPQVPLVQEAVRVVTTQLGSQGRFCLPYPEFAMQEIGRVCSLDLFLPLSLPSPLKSVAFASFN